MKQKVSHIPPCRAAEPCAARTLAGSTARPTSASCSRVVSPAARPEPRATARSTSASCSRVLLPASCPPWRALNPARRGSRRDRHRGQREHHIPPRRAAEPNAARTPTESTARLTSASCSPASIPRGAPQTPRDAEAGEIDTRASERTTSPRVAPPNPALRGRRGDRPRGGRARPAPRVVSPRGAPQTPRDAEAGEINLGASEREHHSPPVSRRRTPCRAGAVGVDREADERVLLPASCPPMARRQPRATRNPAKSISGPASAPHPPASRRRTPCCAGAGGIDCETDERVLLLPWHPPPGDHPGPSTIPNCSGIKKWVKDG